MLEEQSYATLLRPIGQMLEGLRIDSFAVKPDRDGFVIRDKTRNRAQLTPRERAFLARLHLGHTASVDQEDAIPLRFMTSGCACIRSEAYRSKRQSAPYALAR